MIQRRTKLLRNSGPAAMRKRYASYKRAKQTRIKLYRISEVKESGQVRKAKQTFFLSQSAQL